MYKWKKNLFRKTLRKTRRNSTTLEFRIIQSIKKKLNQTEIQIKVTLVLLLLLNLSIVHIDGGSDFSSVLIDKYLKFKFKKTNKNGKSPKNMATD